MGKVLPFPGPKNGLDEANKDGVLDNFVELFTEDDINDIKSELDFLNELDDLGIDPTTPTEES